MTLSQMKCVPGGQANALAAAALADHLAMLPDWTHVGNEIRKTFVFKNYHQTMAFVNAAAWISHREDHHPDIAVGYGQATVAYMTHAIKGISENDFICAAKIDALFDI